MHFGSTQLEASSVFAVQTDCPGMRGPRIPTDPDNVGQKESGAHTSMSRNMRALETRSVVLGVGTGRAKGGQSMEHSP